MAKSVILAALVLAIFAAISACTPTPATTTTPTQTLAPGAPKLTAIAVSPDPGAGSGFVINPAQGDSVKLSATGTYSDGSTQDIAALVTWVSSDPTIVMISPTGLATGGRYGQAYITAKLDGVSSKPVAISSGIHPYSPVPPSRK